MDSVKLTSILLKYKNNLINSEGLTNEKAILRLSEQIINNTIESYDFKQIDKKIINIAFDNIIQDGLCGKILGQFFTPPSLKKLMIEMLNPDKFGSICDPAMGIGGLLIEYINHFKDEEIDLNQIYGKEIDKVIFKLANVNIELSTGFKLKNLQHGDSLNKPIKKKFDYILANPPFGLKDLKVENNEFIPIKTSNTVFMFIQVIINMLKIGGKAVVVLPHGCEMCSKSNKKYIRMREYLLKTCDLKEFLICDKKEFMSKCIKTCIISFVKKSNNETSKYQTENIKFYDDNKTLLSEAPIESLINNNLAIHYIHYVKYENDDINKELGDILVFLPKSKRYASYGKPEGKYPFYTSSKYCTKYCDDYDYEEECLIIGNGGNANIKLSSKFSCSGHNFICIVDGQLIKYVYYYLLNNMHLLQNGFYGVGVQKLNIDYLKKIRIPIPTIEKQQEIIDYFEHNNKKIEDLKIEAEKYRLEGLKLFD